jgi:MFS transporter, ACS family, hexuronate transporter
MGFCARGCRLSLKGIWSYENRLLFILGLSFGFAFFDRNAINYLAPYIVPDLGLNNTQVGMLGSALALSWAVSAFVIGRWSDAVGVRKPFLVGILMVFSCCSILSGLAKSFPMLLASRLLMGIAEGPFMPICVALLTVESSPRRRGLNIGIVQSLFASLLGAAFAPAILVRLAAWFSWRAAFFLSGIPGVLCALAIMRWVREPEIAPSVNKNSASGSGKGAISFVLKERNIRLCCLIACLMVSWLMLHQNFLTLFLTTVRGTTRVQAGDIMSATGYCAAIVGFVGAGISDRLGRKPVIIGTCFVSMLTPLAGLFFHGSLAGLTALMVVGWIGTAAFALFMAVVPGETLPARYTATAMGLVTLVGEVIGGSCSPLIAGRIADTTSLAAPLQIAVFCALGGTILALFLKETAPAKTGAFAEERENVKQVVSA